MHSIPHTDHHQLCAKLNSGRIKTRRARHIINNFFIGLVNIKHLNNIFLPLHCNSYMRDLSEIMRKSLSQKFLGKQAIGSIAQNIIHKMFPQYAKDMLVYIKTHIIFIKPANHRDKVALYKEKARIIESVNT